MAESQQYSDVIRRAAKRLRVAGVETPQREARLLMGLAADLSTAQLIMCEQEAVPEAVSVAYDAMVQRRVTREPFAHLAGERAFYGLAFVSDARALVPRPDSECVVDLALERLAEGEPLKIADLGTGSGCLLVAILKTHGLATGVGVEANDAAASLARENVARHGLRDRAEIANMSWVDWAGWSEVDLIVSNPPYIASHVIETLAPEVRLYDPADALDGGGDGLASYREIISLASQQMKHGAHLILEIGYDQKMAVSNLLSEAGFTHISAYKDLNGHDRVVIGVISTTK